MKKFLSFFLLLAMVMVSFSACGNGEDPAGTDAVETTPAQSEPADSQGEQAQDHGADEASPYPLVDEPVTLTCLTQMPNANKTITTPAQFAYYDVAAEVTGVSVEWDSISADAILETLNIIVAADELPDIVNCASSILAGGISKAIEEGAVYDISPLMEEYAPDYYERVTSNEDTYRNVTDSNGKMVVFYQLYEYSHLEWGSYARADWMEALGFDELITYEDWHNFLLAVKTEYNAATPLLFTGNATIYYNLMAGGYGVTPFANDTPESQFFQKDGAVHSSLLEDGYKEYLRMCNEWYSEGIISPDYINVSIIPFIPDRRALMLSGSAIFSTIINSMENLNLEGIDEGYRVIGISDPVMEKGDTVHFTYVPLYSSHIYTFVSANCEAPEVAVAYINYFYTQEGMLGYNYGIENESYVIEDGEVVLTDIIMNSEDGPGTTLDLYSGSSQMFGLVSADRYTRFFGDATYEAIQVWSSNCDDEWYCPSLTVSADEYPEYAAAMAEITTYASEAVNQFITGALSIDADWDAYIEALERLGIHDVLAAYQDNYDALVNKIA